MSAWDFFCLLVTIVILSPIVWALIFAIQERRRSGENKSFSECFNEGWNKFANFIGGDEEGRKQREQRQQEGEGLFGSRIQEALPPFIQEIMGMGEFTEERRRDYVQTNKHYILARKEEILELKEKYKDVQAASIHPLSGLVAGKLPQKISLAVEECWKQLILAEEIEREERKLGESEVVEEPDEPTEIERFMNEMRERTARNESIGVLMREATEARNRDLASIDRERYPELYEQRERMWRTLLMEMAENL